MPGNIYVLGGGTKLFAAIGVTYPAGSTLTCTNGSKTLTAKNTSGQWVFAIPEASTWTVTSTDPTDSTKTKSQSVSITKEGQFESVELSYRRYLIEKGAVGANALSQYSTGQFSTFSIIGDVFRAVAAAGYATAYFDTPISVADYEQISVKLNGGKSSYNVCFGLVTTKKDFATAANNATNYNIFDVASVTFKPSNNTIAPETKAIDLQSLGNKTYYLGFTIEKTGGFTDTTYGGGGIDIADIYLE